MTGRLYDTYAAALQHDLVDLPEGTVKIGVVRRPTRWFAPAVDENLPALGPPPDLLDAVQDRREALAADGLDESTAHDRAWEEADFDRRYREHLRTSDEAGAAMDRVRDLLEDGRDVALVCYENTDEKRCHRTQLRKYLEG